MLTAYTVNTSEYCFVQTMILHENINLMLRVKLFYVLFWQQNRDPKTRYQLNHNYADMMKQFETLASFETHIECNKIKCVHRNDVNQFHFNLKLLEFKCLTERKFQNEIQFNNHYRKFSFVKYSSQISVSCMTIQKSRTFEI